MAVYQRYTDFEGRDCVVWTRAPDNPDISLEELTRIAEKEFLDIPFPNIVIFVASRERLFLMPKT